MKLIRFRFRIATASSQGNIIEYINNGEKVKDAEGIRKAVEEALRIAFPEEDRP